MCGRIPSWRYSIIFCPGFNLILSSKCSSPSIFLIYCAFVCSVPNASHSVYHSMTRIQDRQAIWSLFQIEQSAMLQELPGEEFVIAYETFEANPAISRVTSLAYDIWTLMLRLQIHCRYVTLVFRDNHFSASIQYRNKPSYIPLITVVPGRDWGYSSDFHKSFSSHSPTYKRHYHVLQQCVASLTFFLSQRRIRLFRTLRSHRVSGTRAGRYDSIRC